MGLEGFVADRFTALLVFSADKKSLAGCVGEAQGTVCRFLTLPSPPQPFWGVGRSPNTRTLLREAACFVMPQLNQQEKE